jgi:hypothetical protein
VLGEHFMGGCCLENIRDSCTGHLGGNGVWGLLGA